MSEVFIVICCFLKELEQNVVMLDTMINLYAGFDVPFVASIGVGDNWAKAH